MEKECGTNVSDKCLGHVYDSSPKSDWCLGGSIKGESKTGSWEEKKRHSVNTEELKIIVKDRGWLWRNESFGGIAVDLESFNTETGEFAGPNLLPHSVSLLDFGTTTGFRRISYCNIMSLSYFIFLSQIVCISWGGSGWWVRYSVLG